jgi:hypothetical protein
MVSVKLFREIFKGRQDIVAKFWKASNGKSGYRPLCRNRGKNGLCKKPCRSCPNKDYIPLSDDLVKGHLGGKYILGLYPLLKNNLCHFIAADFDDHSGKLNPLVDVKAFSEICSGREIPLYILRSKSGRGYHAYIFFQSPVPATKARGVVYGLLRESQVIGDNESKSTFDRLFPTQGKLNGRGFGNLIALPFQGKASKNNHTLFLDPGTEFSKPYDDQTKILRNIERISEPKLDELIKVLKLNSPKYEDKRANTSSVPNKNRSGLYSADFEQIVKKCRFITHCKHDAEKLSEPEWYAFITIASRCENGEQIVHDASKPYNNNGKRYNYKETQKKIEHALNDTGPYTCETIKNRIKNEYCGGCGQLVKSPIVFGNKSHDEIYRREIDNLNKEYAVVDLQGKCLVLKEYYDVQNKRPDISFSKPTDFHQLLANKKVTNLDKGTRKEVSISKIWFESKLRREYKGIVFDPNTSKHFKGYYNLYRGMGVKPKKGKWSLMDRHIKEVISCNNLFAYNYIKAWLAQLFQNPGGVKPGTAIVLRGDQGVGKGIFASNVGKIIGHHFVHITSPEHLTGRFNFHLKDKLLVFCDEAIWGGDKSIEGRIKGYITEDNFMMEQKGIDAITVANHMRFIIASNNDWVVPAGLGERRMFVLDVSSERKGDYEYFKKLAQQMESGGLEAMLYDLLDYDYSKVNLKEFPKTEALFDQIIKSMTPVQKFWFERLWEGSFGKEYAWGEISSEDLYNQYLEFSKTMKDRNTLINKQFGKELRKMCPGILRKQKRIGDKRLRVLVFPSIGKCRKQFELKVNMKINWDEDEIPP